MANRRTTQGKCQLCQGTFGKVALTRHLTKCLQAQEAGAKGKKGKLFHLVVQGWGNPEYWLHLEMPATATLAALDSFLRDIWLECCGHLSAFTIEGKSYSVSPDEYMDDRDMNVALGKVLRPGMTFSHEYDFGTTTMLKLKVVAEREGVVKGKEPVRLLARNDLPEIPCGNCGKPATQVDVELSWEPEGWLCDTCAGVSEDDDYSEGYLPVVNSPRVGMCGYTG